LAEALSATSTNVTIIRRGATQIGGQR
jgi:hypothetical protein